MEKFALTKTDRAKTYRALREFRPSHFEKPRAYYQRPNVPKHLRAAR